MKRKLLSYLLFFWLLFNALLVQAQCEVQNFNDSGGGSLRDVINTCGAGGTITFNAGILTPGDHVIMLGSTSGPNDNGLSIGKSLTIQGPDPATGVTVTIDGSNLGLNTFAGPPPLPYVTAFSFGWWGNTSNGGLRNLSIINCPGTAVEVGNVSSANITFDGLFIGTKADGTIGVNDGHGISINGAAGTTISNSVISGNSKNGIEFINGASNATVDNNIIGPNVNGTACIVTGGAFEDATYGGGNGYDGVQIQNSNSITVTDNTISCNGHATDPSDILLGRLGKRGLYIEGSDDNIITGNKIGTDINGNNKLPNYKSGLLISQGSDNNTIGGSTVAERNVISGNGIPAGLYGGVLDKHGIVIDWGSGIPSTNNKISGNYIGVANNGSCLPNEKNGIEVIGEGSGNIIGGITSAEGNIIGCNGTNGVSIGMGASTNTIQNNYIGTNSTGADLGNLNNGILLSSGSGSTAAELVDNVIISNIVGYNRANGIQTFGDEEIDGIEIKGNYIGIHPDGDDIGNFLDGILIQTELTNIEIGGINPADRNFISNNLAIGINIAPVTNTNAGTNNQIRNNYIGTTINGNADAGNGGTGITINANVEGITIGGAGTAANIIAGNGGDGIFVTGTNTNNINIQGNKLGVAANNSALKNDAYGIQVDNASGLVNIGTTTGNIIYGNDAGGILLKGATGTTTVQNNTIGNTTAASLGNAITIEGRTNTIDNNDIFNYADNGVNITGGVSTLTTNDIYDNIVGVFLSGAGATGNIIGTAASGNDIHNNRSHGISLAAGANNNTISNNQIGTAGANAGNGINLDAATSNTINGGNVIVNHSNAGQNGIFLGSVSNANTIAGNFIGNDGTTTTGLGNGNGIVIDNSADNTIGGYNFIAGNEHEGIIIQGASSTGNIVVSNKIGISAANDGMANGGNGIVIQTGARNNIIGGIAVDDGNVISANGLAGIQITGANNNSVLGNIVGLDSLGIAVQPNGTSGISISNSTGTSIGDGSAAGSNTISGNTEHGIVLSASSSNTINTNNIGTNAAGTTPFPNGNDGINLNTSPSNTINGNLLAGNTQNGISINSNSHNNTLTNNFIGSNSAGTIIANGDNGVFVSSSNGNAIGTAGNGNTISGNTLAGILLDNASNSTINANHIGTNAAGTSAIANENGIVLQSGSSGNNIGGLAANTISGNTHVGIVVNGSTTNTITNNIIGAGDDGNTALSNATGIRFENGGATNTVLTNTIAHNTSNGIQVDGAASVSNLISQNSMFCNTGMGILESAGGNTQFLQPQLSVPDGQPEFRLIGGVYTLTGTFTGAAGATVEVFEKDDATCENCDLSRVKEGKTYVGSATVSGNTYEYPMPGFALADSTNYVITVTSAIGNHTSEFSLCSTIKCIKPDVVINPLTPAPVCAGNTVVLTALGGATGNDGALFTWYEASDLLTPLKGFEVQDDSIFTATVSGDYLVTVRNGSCDSTSNPVTVVVSPPVNLTFTIEHSDSCGTDGALLISNLDAATTYILSYEDPAAKSVVLPAGLTTRRVPLPVLTGGASYTNIILDSAGCKSAPQTAIINGLTPEIAAAQEVDISICGGTGSISIGDLIGTSYNVTYVYQSATSLPVTVGPTAMVPNVNDSIVINNLQAGDYTNFQIEIFNCTTTVAGPITIDPFSESFDPTVSGSDSICSGGTISFTAPVNTGATFDWYSVPPSGIISGAPLTTGVDLNTFNPATNGDYRLVVSRNGCSDTSDVAYAYVADPQNYTAIIEQEDSCNTGAAILISGLTPGYNPYTIDYVSTAGIVAAQSYTANSSGEIRIPIAAPENISVINIDSSGCVFTASPGLANAFSIPAPTKTVTPISVCNANDGEIEFSGLANGSYNVSRAIFPSSPTTAIEVVSAGTPTIVSTGLAPGDYITIIERNNCEFSFRDTLVNPGQPVISVAATDPATCGGNGSIAVNVSNTSSNYDVYYNGSLQLSNQSGSPVTISGPAGPYTNIYVDLVAATCPSNDTSVVLKDPAKPGFTVTPNSPTLCDTANGSIVISGLVSGRSYTIDYQMGATGGTAQTQISGTGPTITIPNLIDTTYRNILVTDVLTGCDSTQAGPFILQDPPIPTFNLGRTNPTICGGNGQLILSNFNPSTGPYQLTYNNPSAVGPIPITPAGGIVSIPLPAGVYTNVVISRNNCFSLPLDTAIRNPVLTPFVSLNDLGTICEGDAISAIATPNPNGAAGSSPTYTWIVAGDTVFGETNASYTIPNLPVGNNIPVKVILNASSPCASPTTAEATKNVNVVPTPVAGITGSTKICVGQSVVLNATGGISGSKYEWYKDGVTTPISNSVNLPVSAEGSYTVKITNGANCSNTFGPHPLEVISVSVNAGKDRDVKIAGDVYTAPLEGISNGNNPRWDLITGSGTITNPQLLNSPVNLGIGIHTLELSDSVGSCRASDQVVIRVRGQIWIPNAISPNGDGSNDQWFISGLESYDKYTIRVYNRYGNKVYESENTYTPWDGTRNGEAMPVATYYYVIEVKDDKNYQGPLTIMR